MIEIPGYWNKVTTQTIVDYLRRDDVVIYDADESENDYGEFLFVTYTVGDAWWTSFGLGYNWHRESTVLGWESYTTSNWRKSSSPLDKDVVIAQILKRHEEKQAEYTAEQSRPKSKRSILHSFIADFTDEDGAISEMQDLDVEDFFGDME